MHLRVRIPFFCHSVFGEHFRGYVVKYVAVVIFGLVVECLVVCLLDKICAWKNVTLQA